jgi:hypothetical protein
MDRPPIKMVSIMMVCAILAITGFFITWNSGRNPGYSEPFQCKKLYKYPVVWQCGMQEDGSPTFTVDMYITSTGAFKK